MAQKQTVWFWAFSDRLWLLKVAAALGLFAWLCDRAQRELSHARPSPESAVFFDEEDRGRKVAGWGRPVAAVTPEGFEIDTDYGRLRILTPRPAPPVGARVMFIGRIVGPRTIESISEEVNEGFEWKRPLNYGLSAATLLVFLWLIRGRFRSRLSEGVLRSRY